MRKAIFKNEIEHYFVVHKISDGNRNKILEALFENPLNSSKQYLLRDKIKTQEHISDVISKLLKNVAFINDTKTIFEVNDDFDLPNILRRQLDRKEKMAVFVGAGVSKLLDIPLWGELANTAINHLYELGELTYDESKKIINDNISPKQKLSIFHNILPKNDLRAVSFYNEILQPSQKKTARNPYELLAELEIPKFSINLDDKFWCAYQRKHDICHHIYYGFRKDMQIIPEAIYQVHGSCGDLSAGTLITMKDYLDFYYTNTDLRDFLLKVFKEYSVLFIGVGLEEFELLQNIVKSGKTHHVLVGTYLNDTNLLRFRKEHFLSALGINVHGYYLDFNGYERLYDVLEEWVKQINAEIKGQFYDKTGEFNDIEL